MPISFKPRRIHFALAACVLSATFCGFAWRESRKETHRLHEINRRLSARVAALNEEVAARQREIEDSRDATERVIDDLEQRIARLTTVRDKLSAELNEKTGEGFAVPNGIVLSIDPVDRKVWINLGEADGLAPRTTFNVLQRVGGEDTKGAIEVTRILGRHVAEARIVNELLGTPIVNGDSIYSPTWHRRAGEAFSLIGVIDIDGDGTADLERLERLVAVAGGEIDNLVDEKGTLRVHGAVPRDSKPQLTESTKFVVVGEIPEVNVDDDPQKVDRIQKILDYRRQLEDAARDHGVRVISLKDFLEYLGFKAKRRIFVPGGEAPYNSKTGSRSGTSSPYSGGKSPKSKAFAGSGPFRE
jgi:hypothetical protein